MSQIFFESFEGSQNSGYENSGWSNVNPGSYTIDPNYALSEDTNSKIPPDCATECLRIYIPSATTSECYSTYTLSSAYSDLYTEVFLNIKSINISTNGQYRGIVRLRDPSGSVTWIVLLYRNDPNVEMRFYYWNGSLVEDSANRYIISGNYNKYLRLEVKYKGTSPASAQWKLYDVDGNQLVNGADNTLTSVRDMKTFDLGIFNVNSAYGECLFDRFVLDNSSWVGAPSDYFAPTLLTPTGGNTKISYPDSDVTAGWNSTGANLYSVVDDTVGNPDDNDYIYVIGPTDADKYARLNIQNITSNRKKIIAVFQYFRARTYGSEEPVAAAFYPGIREGSTDYISQMYRLTDNFNDFNILYEVSKSSSKPWTWTDIDNLVLVYKAPQSANGKNDFVSKWGGRISQTYLQIIEGSHKDRICSHVWFCGVGTDWIAVGARMIRPTYSSDKTGYIRVRYGSSSPPTGYFPDTTGVQVDSNSDWSYIFKVTGLSAGTPYYFDIETSPDGSTNWRSAYATWGWSGYMQAKTVESSTSHFDYKVVVFSDTHDIGDNKIYSYFDDYTPVFALCIGDLITNPASYAEAKEMYKQKYKIPSLESSMCRKIPLLGIYDDHDSGGNNADKTIVTAGAKGAFQLYRMPQVWPSENPNGQYGYWHKYDIGDVRWIMLDVRTNRDPDNYLPPDQTSYSKAIYGSDMLDGTRSTASGVDPTAKTTGNANMDVTNKLVDTTKDFVNAGIKVGDVVRRSGGIGYFGNTTAVQASSYRNANRIHYFKVSLTAKSILEKIRLYVYDVTDSSTSMKAAIYNDSGGVPGSLISGTESHEFAWWKTVSGNNYPAWITFYYPEGITLDAGTYWLALWWNTNTVSCFYEQSGGNELRYQDLTYGEWPSTANSSSLASSVVGCYMINHAYAIVKEIQTTVNSNDTLLLYRPSDNTLLDIFPSGLESYAVFESGATVYATKAAAESAGHRQRAWLEDQIVNAPQSVKRIVICSPVPFNKTLLSEQDAWWDYEFLHAQYSYIRDRIIAQKPSWVDVYIFSSDRHIVAVDKNQTNSIANEFISASIIGLLGYPIPTGTWSVFKIDSDNLPEGDIPRTAYFGIISVYETYMQIKIYNHNNTEVKSTLWGGTIQEPVEAVAIAQAFVDSTYITMSRKVDGIMDGISDVSGLLGINREIDGNVFGMSNVMGSSSFYKGVIGNSQASSGSFGMSKLNRKVTGSVLGNSYLTSMSKVSRKMWGNVLGSLYLIVSSKFNRKIEGNVSGNSYIASVSKINRKIEGNVLGNSYLTSISKVDRKMIGTISGISQDMAYARINRGMGGTILGQSQDFGMSKVNRKIGTVSVGNSGMTGYLMIGAEVLLNALLQVLAMIFGDTKINRKLLGNISDNSYAISTFKIKRDLLGNILGNSSTTSISKVDRRLSGKMMVLTGTYANMISGKLLDALMLMLSGVGASIKVNRKMWGVVDGKLSNVSDMRLISKLNGSVYEDGSVMGDIIITEGDIVLMSGIMGISSLLLGDIRSMRAFTSAIESISYLPPFTLHVNRKIGGIIVTDTNTDVYVSCVRGITGHSDLMSMVLGELQKFFVMSGISSIHADVYGKLNYICGLIGTMEAESAVEELLNVLWKLRGVVKGDAEAYANLNLLSEILTKYITVRFNIKKPGASFTLVQINCDIY